MKNIKFCLIALFILTLSPLQANQTRMSTLMTGIFIDDITNINIFPHQLIKYRNSLYADVTETLQNYGIVLSPETKYGAFSCWQNIEENQGFNIGYAVNIARFDIGVAGSPIKDHTNFGVGLGRTYFNRRFDLSFVLYNEPNTTRYTFNLRLSRRKGDFIIIPAYSLNYVSNDEDLDTHKFGLMFKRLILNEGFVYLAGEYELINNSEINDLLHIYSGLELPIGKHIVLLCGIKETMTYKFESPEWRIEPGISLRIREFSFDFQINSERFFDDDVNLLKSVGFDLDFSKF